jgi:hypothetical protein
MSRFILLLYFLFLLTSCGPDEAVIKQTVEQQVAAAITATLSAQPTVTPYPTATAYATGTLIPTLTPKATSTLLPTATPYPTTTPYPSFTPTTTPSPTLTPVPLPTRDPNAAAPPPPAPANIELSLVRAMTDVRNAISAIYHAASAGDYRSVINCQVVIPAYDTIVNAPTFDVTGTDPVVQSAYGVYRQVITDLTASTTNTTILAQDCREPYNNGVAEISYGRAALQGLIFELGYANSPLISALQSIGGS